MSREFELDLKQFICPMPVIKTQAKIASLRPTDILTVYCSDPGTLYDIPAWCRIHGHKVIATKEEKDVISIKIEVS